MNGYDNGVRIVYFGLDVVAAWNRSFVRELMVYGSAVTLTVAGIAFEKSTPTWLWLILGAISWAISIALGIHWSRQDLLKGEWSQ
jgi:hypothetical protein